MIHALESHKIEVSQLKEERKVAEESQQATIQELHDQLQKKETAYEERSGALIETLTAVEAARDAARYELEILKKSKELALAKDLHEGEVEALRKEYGNLEEAHKEMIFIEEGKKLCGDEINHVSLPPAHGGVLRTAGQSQHLEKTNLDQSLHRNGFMMENFTRKKNKWARIIVPVVAGAAVVLLSPAFFRALSLAAKQLSGWVVGLAGHTALKNNIIRRNPFQGVKVFVDQLVVGVIGRPLHVAGMAVRSGAVFGAFRAILGL
uniref:Uncharacterized protein n=1 Tax=Trieres chinensis TaxID=1514140 RepID=A0A7S1ZHM8_TRICV|mmetsp:Transcript_25932/g.53029  ORF Transcript_25932/g.53029 Transcript_25932/m.53029 type:complete len:264 (+) Transcript_25932:3-794(+)